MTDVSRVHLAAIVALLAPVTDGTTAGYTVYQGSVTVDDSELTFPYLVVRMVPASRQLLQLGGPLSDARTLTQLLAVGQDENEVLAALDRASECLHGHKPVIVGRDCGYVRQEPGNPFVIPSDDVHTPAGQPSYQGVAFFELISSPASGGS